jgi:hypothetical protein
MIAAAKEPRSTGSQPKCVVPGCTRQAYSRGLCLPCNRAARKLVEKGETTWKELESMGFALPKKGDQVNALVAAFREAKQTELERPVKVVKVAEFRAAKSKSRSK